MIKISDITMKQAAEGFALSFREKIELAKLLDKLGAAVIEAEGLQGSRTDVLRIKSIAAAVENSTVSVPVELNAASVEETWNALQLAKHPRLQVCAPVSSVQMEYLYHKKPDAMLAAIADTVSACAKLTETEFVAQDATRSEADFLYKAIETAITAGASTITVLDSAGNMLSEEFYAFIAGLLEAVPALKNVTLGVGCADTLAMADSCVIAAVKAGAGEIKASVYPQDCADFSNVAKIIIAKGDDLQAKTNVNATKLSRIVEQIQQMCRGDRNKGVAFGGKVHDDGIYLTAHDTCDSVCAAVEQLGYDLSQDDRMKVYEAFMSFAEKRDKVSIRELDAIVANAAMQVPATYRLDNYVITSGSAVSATAHMKLTKNGESMEGVTLGDGPIDAAFCAIEQIIGRHYELDDFQIQAVTEGREAMGQTIVRLRSAGKVFSGRGISTDIVGASIQAYLNALNKIVYEEEEA